MTMGKKNDAKRQWCGEAKGFSVIPESQPLPPLFSTIRHLLFFANVQYFTIFLFVL